jgi:hypothetical protein
MSRTIPLRVIERSAHPDAKLISLCIEYGLAVAGAKVIYQIDPTDAEFASRADTSARARADRSMEEIIGTATKTMDGLRAKAAIVKLAIDDWEGNLDDLRQRFLISIADDIIRMQRALMSLEQSAVEVAEA